MSDQATTLYEGLFLLDQQAVATDFTGAIDALKTILGRSNAEIEALAKWDERKLAYEIKGQRRGTYLIALFRCPGAGIAKIERDCNLSETVMRCLIVRGDNYGQTEIDLLKQESEALIAEAKLRTEQAEAEATTEANTPAPAAPVAEEAPAEAEAEAPAATES